MRDDCERAPPDGSAGTGAAATGVLQDDGERAPSCLKPGWVEPVAI